MFWGKDKNKEKDQEERARKASPTDEARLATYARTRAVQENEILGHHYWEMHKRTDTNLWQINRVELTEEADEDNPGQSDIFRSVKAQYYHLNFFDAIKQMADFENYLTVSTAEYINETTEELGEEHYIHVAEQEGFIVFDAKSKRPVYAPNGKIPNNGKFRESDLQRAFARSADIRKKHPEVFDQENVTSHEMQPANSNSPIPVKVMAVPENVGLLSDILNVTSNFTQDTKAFERMKEMDEIVNELKVIKGFLKRGIYNPEDLDYHDYPYKQKVFSFVEDGLTAIAKHIKDMNEIKEHKGKIVNFINRVSLHVAMVEVQSWNKCCKDNPEKTKTYKDEKEEALKKVVKFSNILGVPDVSTATIDLTIGQKNPEFPAFLEEFIESYTVWKDQQLEAVKEAQTAPQKMAIPQIKTPQIGHK